MTTAVPYSGDGFKPSRYHDAKGNEDLMDDVRERWYGDGPYGCGGTLPDRLPTVEQFLKNFLLPLGAGPITPLWRRIRFEHFDLWVGWAGYQNTICRLHLLLTPIGSTCAAAELGVKYRIETNGTEVAFLDAGAPDSGTGIEPLLDKEGRDSDGQKLLILLLAAVGAEPISLG